MSEVGSSGTYLVPLGNSGDSILAAEIAKLSSALPSFERGIILKYSIPAALMSEFGDEWKQLSLSPASLLLLKEKLARKISIFEYQECGSLFSSIFRDFSSERSKEIAKENVRRLSIDNSGDMSEKMSSKVYGEIEFHSFCNLLERVGIQKGEVLYDLGHGTGKAMVKSAISAKLIIFFYCSLMVLFPLICTFIIPFIAIFRYQIAASLLFGDKLKSIKGVELLKDLFDMSVIATKTYDNLIRTPENWNLFESRRDCQISVYEGDFLVESSTEDWTDADIVFANSTCFDSTLMKKLAHEASRMRRGARFITFTSQLPSDSFEVVEKINLGMSWGVATCFLHRR